MFRSRSDVAVASSVVFAVFLWGGNNAGTRYIVATWPPIWTGATRFACAGLILLALLRFTSFLGSLRPLDRDLNQRLWVRGGLSLAVYIVCFNFALKFTTASHVALYLGAAPVWALLWEGRPERTWRTAQRYAAALLALTGVLVLFWPALHGTHSSWIGEVLGLAVSVLWTNYGRQCRALSESLSGVEISAHTMWRAGLMLLPIAAIEVMQRGVPARVDIIGIQVYCIIAGGVMAFALWNNALRHWPTSQVLLFNNLIPLSTGLWAHFTLGEPLSRTFWIAMILIVAGVVIGQTNWQRKVSPANVPAE